MKIGIVDWGVGGLGFYQLLHEHRPDIDVIYLGDQGQPSYGTLSHSVLAARISQISREMESRGAERVVVACNAASTVLRSVKSPIPISGVIEPTLTHLLSRDTSEPIGVIGGRRTILSGSYSRPLRKRGYTVLPRVAQPLSGIIEAGKQAEAGPELQIILGPILHVPRLVLACTHYIVLADQIREMMPKVEFEDPATLTWGEVEPLLSAPNATKGTDQFFTTGNPARMKLAAHLAFGVEAEIQPW